MGYLEFQNGCYLKIIFANISTSKARRVLILVSTPRFSGSYNQIRATMVTLAHLFIAVALNLIFFHFTRIMFTYI